MKVDLSEYESASYLYQWIDLVTEKKHNPKQLKGGDVHIIKAPEDFPGVRQEKDWILLIKLIKHAFIKAAYVSFTTSFWVNESKT